MSSKKYVYYPPRNPQFFFPKDSFKDFQKYYRPYSFKAQLFWGLYKTSELVRRLFLVDEDQIPLPIVNIKEVLLIKQKDYECFFNIGTKGLEQKATVIARIRNQSFFLKLAQSDIAKELVVNEYNTLKELDNCSSIDSPKIIGYKENNSKSYIALVTNVINGEKLEDVSVSYRIIDLLIKLSKIRPSNNFKKEQVFAHGDFCPWNILVSNKNELVLIDWEMAGDKPLGYDLFTFIFQTSFLLIPQRTITEIVVNNKSFIDKYFEHFKIVLWQPYLKKFANLKLRAEEKKENSILIKKYHELLNYYEES
jgi:tRNA A-37 threonylcarbamoyl transferase component Bud32